MSATRTGWFVFGRESDDPYDPWWPLYQDEGAHLAVSAEKAIATIRERLALGGEANLVDLAAIPAADWHGPSLKTDSRGAA